MPDLGRAEFPADEVCRVGRHPDDLDAVECRCRQVLGVAGRLSAVDKVEAGESAGRFQGVSGCVECEVPVGDPLVHLHGHLDLGAVGPEGRPPVGLDQR